MQRFGTILTSLQGKVLLTLLVISLGVLGCMGGLS